MKKSELREMIKRELLKEGNTYDKYSIKDEVRSALLDAAVDMVFYYGEDDTLDYPDAHKKAIGPYKKWADKVLKQIKQIKEESRENKNIYDVTFEKNLK